MTVVLGSSIQVFVNSGNTGDNSQLTQDINKRIYLLMAIAGGAMVASYIQNICWMLSGERISVRIREAYFNSLLQQDIEYLDGVGTGHVTTAISSHINIIQDTISQKTSLFISSSSTFLCAFIIAFIRNWRLAIIISAILPMMTLPTAFMSMRIASNVRRASEGFSQAHSLASEAITHVPTVRSLGIQDVMVNLYDDLLRRSERLLFRKCFWLASIHGWTYLILFSAYALAFWEGSRLVLSNSLDIGVVVNVLFSVVIGMLALGRVARYLESFATAVSVAKHIFGIIGRRRGSLDSEPKKWTLINGDITFENVTFSYAARPEVPVLGNLNLHIPAGKMTAIVGASGCGKSTIIGLLERFYEPTSGNILIDGLRIETLNISALRSQISFLSQEPTLFSMSIYENVRLGLLGTPFENARPCVLRRMVVEACILAGISDVIDALPQRYDTSVGPKGTLLSGGQRQRLAFARAIIRNPKVLVLDEPTSALDQESEYIIQDALEKISVNRTVIIIAHRLNTIRKADSIVVIDGGKVAEQGTHEELLQRKGAYFSLSQAQESSIGLKSEYESSSWWEKRMTGNTEELSRWSLDTTDYQERQFDIPKAKESKHGTIHHLLQIQRFNMREKYLMILGFIAAIACGAVYPVQAFLIAKMMVLSTTPKDPSFSSSANLFSLAFLIIAGVKFISHFTSTFTLGVCCEKMIGCVRSLTFRSILGKKIEWFHDSEHSAGNLVFCLSELCAHLVGLHGSSLVTFIEIATNLISGSVFSVIIAWEYALVIIPVVPLIVFAGYVRVLMLGIFQHAIAEWHNRSAILACESIASIRTVAALTRERQLMQIYRSTLDKASRLAAFSILRSSVILSVAYGMTYLVNAFAIWYGARLIVQGRIDLYQYFAVYIALTFGAQDAGELAGRVPDFALGKEAADQLLELRSQGDELIEDHSRVSKVSLLQDEDCSISIHKVSFAYGDGTEEAVLSNISISIQQGQHIALVGASGSGKSTLLGLLARFYTPSSGSIEISRQEISTIDPASYHSVVSLVPQEPVLFPGTILFNLIFNASDISQEALEEACRQANILEFIQSLPDGFETQCSNVMLSVGQKQRIVIARALVRNPKILLLDEPTASLDSLSVNHVLAALESASKGRTTVTVAHNLTSVLGMDVVYVLQRGRIVESGPPLDLLRNGGAFADMARQRIKSL